MKKDKKYAKHKKLSTKAKCLIAIPICCLLVGAAIGATVYALTSKRHNGGDGDNIKMPNSDYIGNWDGTNWKGYNAEGGSLTLEESSGSAYILAQDSYGAKDLIIPDYVRDDAGNVLPLTSIGEYGMQNSALTGTLTLGTNIESLDSGAFFSDEGSFNLSTIYIHGNLKSTNDRNQWFYSVIYSSIVYQTANNIGDDNLVIVDANGKVLNTPNHTAMISKTHGGFLTRYKYVKANSQGTLEKCVAAFGHIKIPSSVSSIGEEAFYQCPHITSVDFGGGLKKLGDLLLINAYR